jgi:hypothetical protein
VFVPLGTLDRSTEEFTAHLGHDDRDLVDGQVVVVSDGSDEILCRVVAALEVEARFIHLQFAERSLTAKRLVESRRPFVTQAAADLTRIARESGWVIAGWSLRLGDQRHDPTVQIVVSDDTVNSRVMLSRQYPAGRMSTALGEHLEVMWWGVWQQRNADAYAELQEWPPAGPGTS